MPDTTINSGARSSNQAVDPVRVGVLGAGLIAQAAHFESCTKAHNATLFAICDVAEDLVRRAAIMHGATRTYTAYEAMLDDPDIDAVIIATADSFHVPASIQALRAGKHVLCEKPVATSVEEAEELNETVARSGKVFRVGHMKRFDPGLQAARRFIETEMGEMVALKAWYCDSTHRYTMTDALHPPIITSERSRKPASNPKEDLRRYYLLAHGSHLVDTARFLGGDVSTIQARLSERAGMKCWFIDVEFASGAMGHLDLTVAVRMDWHEGFHIYGQHGSITGKTYNPWYFKSSDVEIFHEADATARRPLGADGHFFRRQVEAFADAIRGKSETVGATVKDGVASVRALAAIARSVDSGQPIDLASVSGEV
ncbi:MAG: Gfo/Idh/MocA family protein [Bacteroidota bacterium]